jgi:hypothetical protein
LCMVPVVQATGQPVHANPNTVHLMILIAFSMSMRLRGLA